MKLTKADRAAIQSGDSNFLVNKGIRYYYDQEFEFAVDYYHLAAAMGNAKAAGNLGYCYIYGRGVPQEVDLSLAYFRIAIEARDVDSFYKLGKIYCRGDVIEQDKELGVYYYENALNELFDNFSVREQLCYPGLFYAMAQEKLPDGGMGEDIAISYKYLLIAEMGYTIAVKDGAYYFENLLAEVREKMENSIFDDVREEMRKEFEEEYLS